MLFRFVCLNTLHDDDQIFEGKSFLILIYLEKQEWHTAKFSSLETLFPVFFHKINSSWRFFRGEALLHRFVTNSYYSPLNVSQRN